jgi:diguanylate cyclase (GGDEF)-like protein
LSAQGHPPVDPEAIRPSLAAIADLMITDCAEPSPGRSPLVSAATATGVDLVKANLTDPRVLSATIEVLAGSLFPALGTDQPEYHLKLVQALGAIAAGFASALRQLTLQERQDGVEAALAALRHQAEHDPLTGLPNRAFLSDYVNEFFRDAKPETRVGLGFLDLDDFKAVNDRFGHDIGDELLVAVAKRISSVVDPTGRIVARFGGDEFVILACGDTGPSVLSIAEEVMRALDHPLTVGHYQLRVSVSIGVAEQSCGQTTAAELVRAADGRMRTAKTTGKGRVVIMPKASRRYRGVPTTLAAGHTRSHSIALTAHGDVSLTV